MWNRSKKENCVKGQIHNLLAIIRFVPNFTEFPDTVPPTQHIAEFKELFQSLQWCSDVDSIDFWSPFLKIIQASDISGPITGVTLSSIHKFLLYGFVSPSSGHTLNKIVNSVVQCRFPRVYSSNDEVVMMKLLHVFLECLKTAAGCHLTDASVWSIVGRCFDVFEKERVSELLRRTVQNVLLQIFLIIFGRIAQIEPDGESYGVPCIRHILLHLAELIGLLDKNDPTYKEKRCSGLFLLNTALETGGESIGKHSRILEVIQNEVCKALLVNSVTDDMIIFSLTLRVVFNLFQSVKRHLKVQLEVFFNSIHLKMAGAYEDSKDPLVLQKSELALESLVDFCSESSLILELYTNYDCDVHFYNIFEALVSFLCKHGFPLNQKLIRLNELCLEGLLAIVSSISIRCFEIDIETRPKSRIREQKALKEKYTKSAEVFNNNPKEFKSRLEDMGILPRQSDARTVAQFLRDNPAIDSTLLGEFLAKKANTQVCSSFMRLFVFDNQRIDHALKSMLSCFKLPGEAQQIDHIMDCFSKAYYTEKTLYANSDAVFILAFSIIMLHTDLHNQNLKVKMSEAAYLRNLRGQNGGQDFPAELLSGIYHNIASQSFQVLEPVHTVEDHQLVSPEHTDNKWGKIIGRSHITGHYSIANEDLVKPAGENEKDMFDVLWEQGLLGTLTNAIECAETEQALSKLKELFVKACEICAYFELAEHAHKLISALCQCFLRNADSLVGCHSNRKVQTVLEAVVECCLKAKALLRSVWTQVVSVMLRLHALKLLPQDLVELDDFVDSEGHILPMDVQEPAVCRYFHYSGQQNSPSLRSQQQAEEGIWSAFTKYLGVPQQATRTNEQILYEIKMELKLKVCDSKFHHLFLNSKLLPLDSFTFLLKALIQRIKQSNQEVNTVLCLQLAVNAASANAGRVPEALWQQLLSQLEYLLARGDWTSERSLVGLLRLCIKHHRDIPQLRAVAIRVLDFMAQLPSADLARYAERLIAGLQLLMNEGDCEFLAMGSGWSLMVSILGACCEIERASFTGLELISLIVRQTCEGTNVELRGYEELLALLLQYAKREANTRLGLQLIHNVYKSILRRNSDEAIIYFWKKILMIVGGLCQDNKAQVRTQAYNLLQDMVLTSSTHQKLQSWPLWKECFEKVLFPLVVEPFIIQRDRIADLSEAEAARLKSEFESSREKAMWLICQALMSKLELIALSMEFSSFWARLIKLMGQALRSKDEINEKPYELIKNFLLVIRSENVLDEELWELTWKIFALDALREDVFGVVSVNQT